MGAFAIKAHYTTSEVAEILCVSRRTVYRYIKASKIDWERVGRGRYMIPLSGLYSMASIVDSMQLVSAMER